MNPSTADILDAVERVNAKTVFVFLIIKHYSCSTAGKRSG